MAEKLCTLRTKGGGGQKYTETSLWTNLSPTSEFAAQTVTLSDSISNYKYIAFKYKFNKGTEIISTEIFPVEYVKSSILNNSANKNVVTLGLQANNNATFIRLVGYISDTSLTFTSGYTTTGSTTNNACNPIEILGLNELAQGEKPVIPTFSIQIAAANNRSAAAMNLDVASYNTLTIGSVTKGSGVTVRNAQIRDVNNTVLYNINVSSSEQTFDVSAQTRVVIVLDASGTTAWQELKADNFYLS